MKVCKIKPSMNTCFECMDAQIKHDEHLDCLECERNSEDFELLSVHSGLFGSYAFIIADGKLQRVPTNRIHCIREV